MPSDVTNQSPNSQGSQSQTLQPPLNPAARPKAEDIVKTFDHADTPLDFVRKNLAKLAAQGINPAHAEIDSPLPAQGEVSPPQPEGDAVPSQPSQSSGPVDTKPAQAPDASSEAQPQPSGTDIQTEGVTHSLADNIKNIRKSLNETKAKLQEKEAELQKITEEKTKYETGEVFPEVVKELETKVQTLSKYQALVDLESSPEYHDTYVKPLEEIRGQLEAVGKDYEVPAEVMDEALTYSNQRDLNRFLSEHFDAAGILDVRELIGQAKKLKVKAEDARKAPKEALNLLIAEGKKAREEQVKQRRVVISAKAKDSWAKSLGKIRAEGHIPELTITGTNTDHDEKVAKPIVGAAATEYGKMVSKLVDAGLEDLPDDLSDAIANMVLLAHASAVSIEQRNEAIRRYDAIEINTRRDTSYTRPPLGGSFGTGQVPAPTKPIVTVEEGARDLMTNVLANYQNRGLAPVRK